MTHDDPFSAAIGSGQPQNFTPLHDARQLLGEKRYREAHAYCRQKIDQDPNNADAYYVLGIISYEHHDFVRALKLFEAALKKQHPEPGPHVQAARCLTNMNRPKQALEQIESAKARNPADSYTLSSIAATLSRLDRHKDAVIFHRKATEAAPNDAVSVCNLGSALQFIGDFDGAKEAYLTSLKLAPDYTPARVHLTMITKHTAENNPLERLQAAWQKRHPQDVEGGLRLAHAFAKVYEDLGDPDSAMVWLDKGKALIRAIVPDQQAQDRARYTASAKLCEDLKPDATTPADGPIFIVGLPRTGTTLIDRILSSHSRLISAGERPDFGACLHRGTGVVGPGMLDPQVISKAAEINLYAVGESYLESVGAILDSPQRFTDKMPINAFLVPAILAALPSARVICLRRHAADSVLSMYRQFFDIGSMHYRCAYDLENLADYVAAFHELVETYSQTLPASRFTILDYESLVAEPEAEIRRLLDFSGLDFEPACLDFQNNAAPVATASVAQVRQPIFKTSQGRWKRYQTPLEPALKILREKGRL